MNRYRITVTYGRTLWITNVRCAESLNAATILAALLFPRASSITVEEAP